LWHQKKKEHELESRIQQGYNKDTTRIQQGYNQLKNEKREIRTPTNACSSFGSTNDANKGTTCSSHKCGNKEASQDFMTISDNVVFPLLQKKSKEIKSNQKKQKQ